MEITAILVAFVVGLGGVLLGGYLARRNDRISRREQLLIDGLNDAISAIADISTGDKSGEARYASATSRIALHGSPTVVAAFRHFQDVADTHVTEGRDRLIAAIQLARSELGHGDARDGDIATLLFGNSLPRDQLEDGQIQVFR